MDKYQKVSVGQIWKDTANGETDIKVTAILPRVKGKETFVSHGKPDGVEVVWQFVGMKGSGTTEDYNEFIDYVETNCYEPVE